MRVGRKMSARIREAVATLHSTGGTVTVKGGAADNGGAGGGAVRSGTSRVGALMRPTRFVMSIDSMSPAGDQKSVNILPLRASSIAGTEKGSMRFFNAAAASGGSSGTTSSFQMVFVSSFVQGDDLPELRRCRAGRPPSGVALPAERSHGCCAGRRGWAMSVRPAGSRPAPLWMRQTVSAPDDDCCGTARTGHDLYERRPCRPLCPQRRRMARAVSSVTPAGGIRSLRRASARWPGSAVR